MLVPAILYRDQIEREFQRLYYTKDMLFETGCLGQWTPEISDSPDDGRFDYAIVSNNTSIVIQIKNDCENTYLPQMLEYVKRSRDCTRLHVLLFSRYRQQETIQSFRRSEEAERVKRSESCSRHCLPRNLSPVRSTARKNT